MFFGTASSFIERISFSEVEAKREAILFLFGCSEVNSTWIITSGLANQRAPKALFTCVVYTNTRYVVEYHTLICVKTSIDKYRWNVYLPGEDVATVENALEKRKTSVNVHKRF